MSKIEDHFLTDLKHSKDFARTRTGDIKTVSGINNLIQWIFNCIITVEGSIIHRPKFGVGAKLYQGSISSLDKQRELALKIRSKLVLSDRIDSVDSIKFNQEDEYRTGTFIINIKVTAKAYGQLDLKLNPFE